jgi:hypothetical protein
LIKKKKIFFSFFSYIPRILKFLVWALEWSDFIWGNFKMGILKSLWSWKLHMIITIKKLFYNFLKFWDLPLAHRHWRLKFFSRGNILRSPTNQYWLAYKVIWYFSYLQIAPWFQKCTCFVSLEDSSYHYRSSKETNWENLKISRIFYLFSLSC